MSSPKIHQVYSNGIYHGLPVLPSTARGLTAVVTGANGISGQHILKVLLSHPEVWTTIIGLSRKPAPAGTPGADPRVQHISVDFLSGAESIQSAMEKGGVKNVDYVFFAAYKENSDNGLWSGQKEMYEENGKMLEDFLIALDNVNGHGRTKRVVIQTGGKAYGMQFGEVKWPCIESDPRVDDGVYKDTPNFYYRQVDLCKEYGAKHAFSWVEVRPSNILGAVSGNYMNEAIAIGLYVAVQKELGEPIIFPGTWGKYNMAEVQTSALLMAYLEEWAALTPECGEQAFNAVNGDAPTWASLWPAVLAHFKVDPAIASPSTQFDSANIPVEWEGGKVEFPLPAPIDRKNKSVADLRISLEKWSKDPKVIKAWERLRDREGLDQKVWDGASWAFADGIISMSWNLIIDNQKAKRYGFFGTVDTHESWAEVFAEAAKQGILPKV